MTNRIYDAFDNIKADARQKELTKQFLHERYRESVRPLRRLNIKYAMMVVCAVVILAMGSVGYSWLRKPVSYVSIDVNPSIELGLNRFDRVVSAKAYNTEGEEILDGLSLRWKPYKEAIHTVMECDDMRSYLKEPSEVVLTVAADPDREDSLAAGVRKCTGHMRGNCHSVRADVAVSSEAHGCGVSCGKYNAYLQLSQYDSTITLDDCKEMSMAQIQEKLREYEENSEGRESLRENEENGEGRESLRENEENGESQECEKGGHTSSHHRKRHRRRGHE